VAQKPSVFRPNEVFANYNPFEDVDPIPDYENVLTD
jgi:hypothetical protein